MYISEFVCGILATLAFEIVAIVVGSIIYSVKKSKKEE